MYLLLFKVTYAIPSVVILLLFLHYLQDNDVQEVEDDQEEEEENDQEQEANEARNVATSILDELLNRVVQTKAEVNSQTLL